MGGGGLLLGWMGHGDRRPRAATGRGVGLHLMRSPLRQRPTHSVVLVMQFYERGTLRDYMDTRAEVPPIPCQ